MQESDSRDLNRALRRGKMKPEQLRQENAAADRVRGGRCLMTGSGPQMSASAVTDIAKRLIHQEQPRALLQTVPNDYQTFCPNFKNLSQSQKANFWATIITRMAKYESDFRPQKTFKEPPSLKTRTGARVISSGLLQISLESGRGYGCNLSSTDDLCQAENNIRCGIRILNRLVQRDGVIGTAGHRGGNRGAARYWAVFRTTRKYTRTARASIITSARAFCNNLPGEDRGQPGGAVKAIGR